MSLILEYGHRIKSENWMANNPLELRKNDYGLETDLPIEFSSNLTPSSREQIKNKYILLTNQYISTMR